MDDIFPFRPMVSEAATEADAPEARFLIRQDADIDALHDRLGIASMDADGKQPFDVFTGGGVLEVTSQVGHSLAEISAFVTGAVSDLLILDRTEQTAEERAFWNVPEQN